MFEMLLNILSHIFHFALHITGNGSFPKSLPPEEEQRLVVLCENGDRDARQKLIEHNLRLVAHVIKKYYNTSIDKDDLISIGTIGLIKGISSFKSEKGIKLATYASRCIENEVLMYFRNLKKSAQDIYISDPIDVDKDGNSLTLLDIISDDMDIESDIENKISYEKLRKLTDTCLDERERLIIYMRYGMGEDAEMPQREVAKSLGISRSYVSRIEKRAIEKLRQNFEKG